MKKSWGEPVVLILNADSFVYCSFGLICVFELVLFVCFIFKDKTTINVALNMNIEVLFIIIYNSS